MKWKTIFAALLLMLLALPLFAQKQRKEDTNTRTVQGTVTDAQGNNVNGAVVQIKNAKTLQIRSFITQDQVTYYFHGISPDVDYELKAIYQGASSPNKTLSAFDNRKKAVINLKLSK